MAEIQGCTLCTCDVVKLKCAHGLTSLWSNVTDVDEFSASYSGEFPLLPPQSLTKLRGFPAVLAPGPGEAAFETFEEVGCQK